VRAEVSVSDVCRLGKPQQCAGDVMGGVQSSLFRCSEQGEV
jgi:hypothetical protein